MLCESDCSEVWFGFPGPASEVGNGLSEGKDSGQVQSPEVCRPAMPRGPRPRSLPLRITAAQGLAGAWTSMPSLHRALAVAGWDERCWVPLGWGLPGLLPCSWVSHPRVCSGRQVWSAVPLPGGAQAEPGGTRSPAPGSPPPPPLWLISPGSSFRSWLKQPEPGVGGLPCPPLTPIAFPWCCSRREERGEPGP